MTLVATLTGTMVRCMVPQRIPDVHTKVPWYHQVYYLVAPVCYPRLRAPQLSFFEFRHVHVPPNTNQTVFWRRLSEFAVIILARRTKKQHLQCIPSAIHIFNIEQGLKINEHSSNSLSELDVVWRWISLCSLLSTTDRIKTENNIGAGYTMRLLFSSCFGPKCRNRGSFFWHLLLMCTAFDNQPKFPNKTTCTVYQR